MRSISLMIPGSGLMSRPFRVLEKAQGYPLLPLVRVTRDTFGLAPLEILTCDTRLVITLFATFITQIQLFINQPFLPYSKDSYHGTGSFLLSFKATQLYRLIGSKVSIS